MNGRAGAWSAPTLSRKTEERLHAAGWAGLAMGWVAAFFWPATLLVIPPFLLLFWLVARRVHLHGPAPSYRKPMVQPLLAATVVFAVTPGFMADGPLAGILVTCAVALGLAGLIALALQPWSRRHGRDGGTEFTLGGDAGSASSGGGDFGGGGASGHWADDGGWGEDMGSADGDGGGGDGGGD